MNRIKVIGKKAIRSFAKPPWESDLMEFQYGLWQGVSAVFTVSGRQLGEENARPFLFNDHIPAKTIICKYDGSRNGHPINMSALKIAMTNFDAALDITKVVLRQHARNVQKTNPTARTGVWDLYIIALASIALVAYTIRKNPSRCPSAIVSDELASQYQFIAGIFMICRDMIDTNNQQISENNPVTASQLYEYADEHKIFESFNGMVCAGSTKKIMEFLEFCVNEMDSAFSKVMKPDDEKLPSSLDGAIDDLDEWYQYAISSIELDCFIKIARRKHRVSNEASTAESDKATMRTYQSLREYCLPLFSSEGTPLSDAFESGSIERQNRILGILKRQPMKSIKQSRLDEQLSYD